MSAENPLTPAHLNDDSEPPIGDDYLVEPTLNRR